MKIVRLPLLGTAHAVVLSIATWCAAATGPVVSGSNASRFDATPAAGAVHSPELCNETALPGRFDVQGDGSRRIDFELNPPSDSEQRETTTAAESPPAQGDANADGIINFCDEPPPSYSFGYNRVRGATTWLPGDEDRVGWFSYESLGGAKIGDSPSLVTGFGIHLLDGPAQTDMPPRLYDFSIGAADRRLIEPNIGYDMMFRVGAFSDFEGSARDGIRYPSHAVTFLRLNPANEFVLGVDYLDRDDIHLLPVVGSIWSPRDWLRVEAVFPRPRVAARINSTSTWIYLGGELGGGTWAIERVNLTNDNATYRDLRLVLGWETLCADTMSSAFEIGYVFDRRLSYSSGVGDYAPPDGFMLRMTAQY